MNEDERMRLIQQTIATCKEEVEGVIGQDTIRAMDAGSPWVRALLRMATESEDTSE